MMNTESSEYPAAVPFEIEARLLSPACLAAAVPAGNLTRTLDYIPGSTVRGALAAHYRATGKLADATFERLFLSGEVTFGNLYCNAATPLPLSARSCKYESGFIQDGHHGVVDWLLPWCVQDYGRDAREAKTATLHEDDPYLQSCQRCSAPLDRFTGFYAPSKRRLTNTAQLRRVLTRSATDDQLHTAEEGLLYSLEVLDPTAFGSNTLPFSGTVVCANQEAADLAQSELLEPFFNTALTLFVGTARSRGLGEIQTSGYQPAPQRLPPVTDRLRDFNQHLHHSGMDEHRLYFSLTLYSDLIVQDELFRPYAELAVPMLAWEGGLHQDMAAKLTLERSFTQTRTVPGWNAILRIPKTEYNGPQFSDRNLRWYSAS